jgi:hypothetical protein
VAGADRAYGVACTESRYGTAAEAMAIEDAMLNGEAAAVSAALRAAQRTRGTELGCPEAESPYAAADTRPIQADSVRETWARHGSATLPRQYSECPPFGREMGAYALGGWYARAAGGAIDPARLDTIAAGFLEVQYQASRTPGAMPSWPGLYGYSERYVRQGDACFIGGVIGDGLELACGGNQPSLCVTYRSGRWSGERFAIGDFSLAPRAFDGGAGFDQGWAGTMMIEAALGSSDGAVRRRYLTSARLAGEWALAEPPVRNHNYSAKTVWLLAGLYELSGEARWRDGLMDRLERNLLPGVLMDQDGDGAVDAVPGLRFAQLISPPARVPGRYWDAHNARPEYQAMNAWALVAAYAALRERGDAALAARVRPYALATLDNLAAEVTSFGAPATSGPGASQPPFALALGLRLIADAEGLPRPEWERALAAFWNAGVVAAPGGNRSSTVALVLQHVQGLPYRSLRTRAAAIDAAGASGAWFDPARAGEGVFVIVGANGSGVLAWYTYDATDASRQLWLVGSGDVRDGVLRIDDLYRADGTRFGAGFDVRAVRLQRWGSASFDTRDCLDARFTWASSDPVYGSGERLLTRLSVAGNSGCH